MKSTGFTLIELLVVITIIAIIASIGLISYQKVSQNGRDGKRQADLKLVQSALEQYFADQFYYPAGFTTTGLFFGTTLDNSIGNPNTVTKPRTYLNKLPCDPATNNCTSSGVQYCYKALRDTTEGCDNSLNNKCNNYKLYARLENPLTPVNYYNACNAANNTYNLEVKRP